jgi:hypothetical protein
MLTDGYIFTQDGYTHTAQYNNTLRNVNETLLGEHKGHNIYNVNSVASLRSSNRWAVNLQYYTWDFRDSGGQLVTVASFDSNIPIVSFNEGQSADIELSAWGVENAWVVMEVTTVNGTWNDDLYAQPAILVDSTDSYGVYADMHDTSVASAKQTPAYTATTAISGGYVGLEMASTITAAQDAFTDGSTERYRITPHVFTNVSLMIHGSPFISGNTFEPSTMMGSSFGNASNGTSPRRVEMDIVDTSQTGSGFSLGGSFYENRYGATIGSYELYWTNGTTHTLITTGGTNYGNSTWLTKTIPTTTVTFGTGHLCWVYLTGTSFTGDYAIDDVTITGYGTISVESTATGWTKYGTTAVNPTTDITTAFNNRTSVSISTASSNYWNLDSGQTPSGSTGPAAAAVGTYYIYAETSSPNYSNKKMYLFSPQITL